MFSNRINGHNQKPLLVGLTLLGWTVYGLFFATQSYFRQAYFGNNPDFQKNLAIWLTCAYSWAVLTPLILILVRRFPFNGEDWLRSLVIHLPTSALFSALALTLFTGFRIAFGETYTLSKFQALLVDEIHAGVLVYFAAVGVANLINYLRGSAAASPSPPEAEGLESEQPDIDDESNWPANGDTEPYEAERPAYAERFSVKKNDRIVFVNVNEIDRVTSDGNYVKLHTNGHSHLVRETMKVIEQKLDPSLFLRIRRSTIVRIEQIKELRPIANSEFEVVLKTGTTVTSSRRYRRNLDAILKG